MVILDTDGDSGGGGGGDRFKGITKKERDKVDCSAENGDRRIDVSDR